MKSLLIRDLRLAFRAGGGFGLALAFFLIVSVIVPFGVGPESVLLEKIAPGILWISTLLACLLSLDRIFQLDFEDGSLDVLAISPMPIEAIVITKTFAHWLTTGVPLITIAPLLGILLHLPANGHIWLVGTLMIGTPALSMIGTFGAALTVGIKRGGLLLSLLVLPLYIPTLILGADTIRRGITGMETDTTLYLMAGISAGTLALLPFASAAAIRINLR